MSEVKWIKLSVNVFDDEKFDAIKTLPDSNDMQLVWVKLLCLAGKCNENGFLMISNEIPYTDEMLAQRFDMDIGVVQRALATFQKLEMLEVVDSIYMVSNWLKYQSLDVYEKKKAYDREYQRRKRAEQKETLLEEKQKNRTINRTSIGRFCSYSISNSNSDNLKYLITNSNYKYKDYISNNTKLLKSIEEWMEYKDGKKPKQSNHYDTEMGMKKVLTGIVEHDMDYGTDAVVKEIDKAIAGNWMGINYDSLERFGKKIQRKTQPQKPIQHKQHTETEKEWDAFFGDE